MTQAASSGTSVLMIDVKVRRRDDFHVFNSYSTERSRCWSEVGVYITCIAEKCDVNIDLSYISRKVRARIHTNFRRRSLHIYTTHI